MPVSPGLHWRNDQRIDDAEDDFAHDEQLYNKPENPFVLAGIIEGQIIPRLVCAHRDDPRIEAERKRDRIAPAQADGFASMVVRLEAHALMEQVDGFLLRGASVESVLVDLLAPAARQLGVWWEEDSCDFVDVTMGLWRLQQVVYELSARIPGRAPFIDRSRNALFSVFPGDQHSFGTVVIDEMFRRKGWTTTCLTSANHGQLIKLVSDHSFDLIGLTISHDDEAPQASELITRLRTCSRNPLMGVMVGGRVLMQSPEMALQMGADGTAPDAESAVARAEIMLQALDGMAASRC